MLSIYPKPNQAYKLYKTWDEFKKSIPNWNEILFPNELKKVADNFYMIIDLYLTNKRLNGTNIATISSGMKLYLYSLVPIYKNLEKLNSIDLEKYFTENNISKRTLNDKLQIHNSGENNSKFNSNFSGSGTNNQTIKDYVSDQQLLADNNVFVDKYSNGGNLNDSNEKSESKNDGTNDTSVKNESNSSRNLTDDKTDTKIKYNADDLDQIMSYSISADLFIVDRFISHILAPVQDKQFEMEEKLWP